MPNAVDIKLTGVKEIDTLMKRLPQQLTKKVLVSAARDAVRPTIREMKAAAPVKTGRAQKSIGVSTTKTSGREKFSVIAGVRSKANTGRRMKNDGWYLKFYEGGTKDRVPRKKKLRYLKFINSKGGAVYVKKTKGLPARPFAEPIISRNMGSIEKRFAESTGRVLLRYMRRTIKNHG